MIDTSMFTSIHLTLYKCTFTKQGFTNVDLPISNYKVAQLEFWSLWLSTQEGVLHAHSDEKYKYFRIIDIGIDHSHRVQRLMLSKGANRWILDGITVIPNYFWQMTTTRSREIIKDDTCLLNLFTKLLVSLNTSIQF